MITLRQLINRYLYVITFILIIFSTMIVSYVQIKIAQDHQYNESLLTLSQIEQIIHENGKELEEIKTEYRKTCLLNAQIISHLLDTTPSTLYDIEELRALAAHLEIDEIHIFDDTGRIISGTHPEYFNLTFESGEQLSFFLPLLTDKSLQLVQEITPNTAIGEYMQYSASWNKSGNYIIQIGMKAENIKKLTEKNEFSYIFSLFRVNPNITYLAIDSESGKITGSTQLALLDQDCTELGFTYDDLEKSQNGFHTNLLNQDCYCVFQKIDSDYIGCVISSQYIYREILGTIGILFLCMLLMAVLLVIAFNEHIKKYVVNKLDKVNEQLASITLGNFDQIVDVRNFHEISELSSHINNLVKTLSTNNTKLTYIFGKNNFFVGTYEYSNTSKHVQFSEYIPQLFSLNNQEAQELSSNCELFKEFIANLQDNLLPNESNIYEVGDKYLRIDEILDKGYMLGVVVDVTRDIEKRQQLQFEIHRDSLTGLYNHIGLEEELEKIFASPNELGHYAMITIMADSLLTINSTYGRENGDIYLRKIADLIKDFGIKNCLASRQGGGEFVLFLYGYTSEAELNKTLNLLTYIQQHPIEHNNGTISFPVIFSFGYNLSNGSEYTNYKQLLKDAIDKKYTMLSVHN